MINNTQLKLVYQKNQKDLVKWQNCKYVLFDQQTILIETVFHLTIQLKTVLKIHAREFE